MIQRCIYDKFIQALQYELSLAQWQCGNPLTSEFGPVSSMQHRDKIESYIELARKDGGIILSGGSRPSLSAPFNEGAFIQPTLIGGLPVTHPVSVEEIFGPVAICHPFDTDDEAIQIANNTKYGLAGSIWTSNLNRAHRLSREWETGMVWVNCWLHRDLRVPFGGVKESGVGVEGGKLSLEFYSHYKNICVHNGPPSSTTSAKL